MKTHLGHYEIVAELGRGGMGVVYKGYEPSLTRYVAIKELSPTLAHDPLVVERFLREARAMALLSEPHIVQIHFIGQENDQPFFAMEFIDGISIAGLIKREGRLPPGDALKIVHQTAQGLSAAHDSGVIHRDIKPANLMVSRRGLVKVGDFGIALANQDLSAKLTSKGELVGTPGYLAPEILMGNPVDQRSDIYALGVVLFEMLTGRTPFADPNVYELMHAVLETAVPDVREFNTGIEPAVAEIVAIMLAKDPARRYQNMRELMVDLERLPRHAVTGPLKVSFSMADESGETMLNMPLPLTPRTGPRGATPPPNLGRRESATPPPSAGQHASPVTPVQISFGAHAAARRDGQTHGKPRVDEPVPAPSESAKKSRWNVLLMAVLMFAAGATWAMRGEISGLFVTANDEVAPYYVAAIITLCGLMISGYWFGVRRRLRCERDAGIQALANMKWRDCVGMMLEVMRRDGYELAPDSKRPIDGGSDLLLHRGNELVLLNYKYGAAERISETNLRDFAGDMQLHAAASGILVSLASAEPLAGDFARQHGIELVDGAALWPKVRQFAPTDLLDHVRLQTAARTWKRIWIGSACSLVLGMVTLVVINQMLANASRLAKAAAPANNAAAPGATARSADAAIKRISAATVAMAEVAKLSDAERVQRRADALKQIKSMVQIGSAGWSSESTVLLALKQSDGVDKELVEQVCGILTSYEELRFARLQLQPPANSTTPVRWRQCQ